MSDADIRKLEAAHSRAPTRETARALYLARQRVGQDPGPRFWPVTVRCEHCQTYPPLEAGGELAEDAMRITVRAYDLETGTGHVRGGIEITHRQAATLCGGWGGDTIKWLGVGRPAPLRAQQDIKAHVFYLESAQPFVALVSPRLGQLLSTRINMPTPPQPVALGLYGMFPLHANPADVAAALTQHQRPEETADE